MKKGTKGQSDSNNSPEANGEQPVGIPSAAVCRELNIAGQTLQRYLRLGCPIVKRGGPGQSSWFDLDAVKDWMKANHLTGEPGNPKQQTTDELKQVRIRRERAAAELAEMKLSREKGKLVERAAVEADNIKKFTTVRNALLGLPAAIAPTVEGLSAPRIQDELEKRINEILTTLSQ